MKEIPSNRTHLLSEQLPSALNWVYPNFVQYNCTTSKGHGTYMSTMLKVNIYVLIITTLFPGSMYTIIPALFPA